MNDQLAGKLIVGAGAPLTGLAVSHQVVNMWLQTASLSIGLLVGILTLLSLIKKRKK